MLRCGIAPSLASPSRLWHTRAVTRTPLTRALPLALGLAAMAAAWRLWPHAPNLTPVAALALFIAWATGRAWLGAALAVVTMAASDLALGLYDLRLQVVVWAMLAAPALLARFLPGEAKRAWGWSVGASLVGALAFFVVTNAAVWAFGTMYPHTPSGLAQCYLAAIPFFRATLAGDLAWTALLFGGAALASVRAPAFQPSRTR